MNTDIKQPVVVPLAQQLNGTVLARHKMDLARKKTALSRIARTSKVEHLIAQLDELRQENEKCDLKLMIAAANYVLYGVIPGQDEKERIPSVEQLDIVCGISPSTRYKWCNEPKNDWHLRFKRLVELLKSKQAVTCLNLHPDPKCLAAADGPNERVAMRVLTKHGYKEQTETEVTGMVEHRIVMFGAIANVE